ncbi:LysR family transcriptional regulator [Agrobacterium sp. NPDC089420]|uniref:LysR family transcriptional regulator n=1 Tax=Agrobacterium sp. NPDC089420 TaxID=3363918 RepID=UPI0038507458
MHDLHRSDIQELVALVALYRSGTFAKAGRVLGRHSTIISKRISALEVRLGVRLVERTTRHVRLTDTGLELARQVIIAQQLIEEAEQHASASAREIRGRLRVALPAAMGRKWLAPLLPSFMRAHSKIELDVHFSEQFTDLVNEGIDVAIRIGALGDSRLVARKLGNHERILCASRDYLEVYGVPERPGDIVHHNCLLFTGFSSFPEWRLSNGVRIEAVPAKGTLISNDSQSLVEAAKAGIGILGAGEWLVSNELEEGSLVRVLSDWAFDLDSGVYLVRPSKEHTPAHVTAFCDWIVKEFADGPPWRRARQSA